MEWKRVEDNLPPQGVRVMIYHHDWLYPSFGWYCADEERWRSDEEPYVFSMKEVEYWAEIELPN